MYRYTVTYVKDAGEIVAPADGWMFLACVLDPESDKLVVVWHCPDSIPWRRDWATATTDMNDHIGEEPI